MKLLLILLFAPLLTFGQIKIGYTEEQIKNSLFEKTWQEGQDEDGTKYIQIKMKGDFYYYFDDFDVCYICTQVIHSNEIAEEMVKTYDKQFTIIDDKQWQFYLDGMTIEVVMNYMYDDKSYVFIYSQKQ